jgi:hypothetical protein
MSSKEMGREGGERGRKERGRRKGGGIGRRRVSFRGKKKERIKWGS